MAWKTLFCRLSLLLAIWFAAGPCAGASPAPEWYQLKTYRLHTPAQAARLDTYLQQAYLPALHRAGITKVGVFKPAEPAASGVPASSQSLLVIVLVPCRSPSQCLSLDLGLAKDLLYQTAARDYLEAAFDQPVYDRIETVMLRAFTGLPTFQVPALRASTADRVYELRSYEGASETLHLSKVAQFNQGEISIFKRLHFNTIFCGQVVAGSHMPNLMYLSAFENQADRDAHWRAFGDDSEWKQLDAQPDYAHNMLRMDVYLLHPTPYSEI